MKILEEIFEEIIESLITLRTFLVTGNDRNYMLPSENVILGDTPSIDFAGVRGRPRFHIDRDTLLRLREIGNSWSSIARIFLVSRWTIHRRANEYGLSNVGNYSEISDMELTDLLVNFIEQQSRMVGFSMAYGYLQSLGLKIQQQRVKDCLKHIDPIFNELRWATLIHRRTYNVRAPNSLWHRWSPQPD